MMILTDPEWTDEERRAFQGDWRAWEEFAGADNSLPADPDRVVAFIAEQAESRSREFAKRCMSVIRRIHELNDLADPFRTVHEDHGIWASLSRFSTDLDHGVHRALTEEEWEIVRAGPTVGEMKSVEIHFLQPDEFERWYELIESRKPPLHSLRIADPDSESYNDVGDPSRAVRAVSSTLKSLAIGGQMTLRTPVNLELEYLHLGSTEAVDAKWFEESTLVAKEVVFDLYGVDATSYLPAVMNRATKSIYVAGATNNSAFMKVLFGRENPPEYVEIDLPYEFERVPGEESVLGALADAAPGWKQTQIRLGVLDPDSSLHREEVESLQQAGFDIESDF